MRWRFQYRLSTLLLLTVICAMAMSWYVDSRGRRSIVGVWCYPIEGGVDYASSLTIRADSTFTKTQLYPFGMDTFAGTYAIDKDGVVIFHVTSKTRKHGPHETVRDETKLDANYMFRCAVDPSGYILLHEINSHLSSVPDDERTGIYWEACMQRAARSASGP